jgi:hypothetical protein
MLNTELVMAVLCAPLNGKAMLQAEKSNNVIIMRRLDYDNGVNYFADGRFITSQADSPIKLMFIFSNEESIVVRSHEDRKAVSVRLGV